MDELIREDGGALPERDLGFDRSWGIARKLAQPQAKLVLPLRGLKFGQNRSQGSR